MKNKVRTFCYFLPQFHNCPYNSKWWGEGFTEWNNVAVAPKLAPDHKQPRIPIDGYYDLTDPQLLEAQFQKATENGIEAFVFYHYWYQGERPLGRPLDIILGQTDLNIKFSLCWANHSWTRTWKNRKGSLDVLIEQVYAKSDMERKLHYEYIGQAMSDPRYTRIDDAALFQIYIPEDVDQLERYVDGLRDYLDKNFNMSVHIAATLRQKKNNLRFLERFDSLTLAQPTLGLFATKNIFDSSPQLGKISRELRGRFYELPLPAKKVLYFLQDLLPKRPYFFDYDETWENILAQSRHALDAAPIPANLTGFIDFDNSPRYRKSAKISKGFSPERFEYYMKLLIDLSAEKGNGLIFLNAWNEWGEGMYMEGDQHYPTERLAALKKAMSAE